MSYLSHHILQPSLTLRSLLLIAAVVAAATVSMVAAADVVLTKPATPATRAANARVLAELPFNDRRDFEDAQRGFIARPDPLTIRTANGNVAWDVASYASFIGPDKPAPDTVNPSLWRNAQLDLYYGLFKVTDRIYQVRGYDGSNITFVQGDTGWIVFDPLVSAETAKAAYDLASANLGRRPVVAVVSATRTSITTAASAASSTKRTSRPVASRSSHPRVSSKTSSVRT